MGMSSLHQETVSQTIDYTYDPLGRLTAADYSTGDYYHYTYDAVGNRLSEENVTNGSMPNENDYTYNVANWLVDISGTSYSTSYTWDANGNLVDDEVNYYTYDPANRLTSIEQGNNSYTFAYSGLGDRLQQTVNSQTTNYTLDLNTGLTQVLDDGTDTYLYGVDRIAQADAANTDYFLGDALGSVRQLADENGEITLGQSYDPYGNVISSIGDGTSVYAFTGEIADMTSLIYLRARYYSGETGRFLSRDTWTGNANQPMSHNFWNYAQSNPVVFTDPSGHDRYPPPQPPKGPKKPCIFTDNEKFCILDNGIYTGAFIDESHFGAGEPKQFWPRLKQDKGAGKSPVSLSQYSIGFEYTGKYDVDIPSNISNTELAGVGAGIWVDYEKRYEAWQFQFYNPAGNHSAFETADIPSTYLGYVGAVKGFSYETIIMMLGGGHSSSTPPPGHSPWDLETWDQCEILKCISGVCPETSARNDTIYLKSQNSAGQYRYLPYPSNLFIEPLNEYWNFVDDAYHLHL